MCLEGGSEVEGLAQGHEAGKTVAGSESIGLISLKEFCRAADPSCSRHPLPQEPRLHSCPVISISESIPETQLPGDGLGPSQPGVGSSSGIQIRRNEGLGPRAAS